MGVQASFRAAIRQTTTCGNSSGFTLGIRAPGQTFNQCLVANAKNYSAGGVFALSTNTDLGTGFVGQLVGGNTFTSLYAGLAGSAEDAVGVAGAFFLALFLTRGD